ncbi:ATP synthase F1 subunit delta [SAR202 cluster bacterium AC-409-J13_OGT_754m]|nr:ATP synthase F1 subunit delta [SAR202 cluster bacterium AC-409-J13_OGT_754m]
MASSISAKRYAQAVFEIAVSEEDSSSSERLNKWAQDLALMKAFVDEEEFRLFLQAASISLEKKVSVISEVLPDTIASARNLLSLMASRGHAERIRDVEAEFLKLLDHYNGVVRVKTFSAVTIDDRQMDGIKEFASKLTGKNIILESQISEKMIGGLTIVVGDRMLDGSTKSRLFDLGRSLGAISLQTVGLGNS